MLQAEGCRDQQAARADKTAALEAAAQELLAAQKQVCINDSDSHFKCRSVSKLVVGVC